MELQIKDILKAQGIAQKQLAERLGMSVQQLNNTVSGRNTASIAAFERIAEALGVEFWQLFAPKAQYESSSAQKLKCPHCGHELTVNLE